MPRSRVSDSHKTKRRIVSQLSFIPVAVGDGKELATEVIEYSRFAVLKRQSPVRVRLQDHLVKSCVLSCRSGNGKHWISVTVPRTETERPDAAVPAHVLHIAIGAREHFFLEIGIPIRPEHSRTGLPLEGNAIPCSGQRQSASQTRKPDIGLSDIGVATGKIDRAAALITCGAFRLRRTRGNVYGAIRCKIETRAVVCCRG